MVDSSLDSLRDGIDGVDRKLQTLLEERAELVHQVGEIKRAGSDKPVFYRPEREAQVLRMIKERNQGRLDSETVARIFREIMSACLALEQPTQVAFLGPEGTFTHEAVLKHFGHAAVACPLGTIDQVFREVEAGAVDYGIVPVENSTEGVVNHTLDSFTRSDVKICGEVELRIHHHFMVGEHTRRDKITRVYSHQQTLAQCRKWLDAHLPAAERVAVSSNSAAVKRLHGEWNAAAIGGEMAAELNNVEIVHRNIEDEPDNTTRFIIIGRDKVPASGNDKTSILVSDKDRPGLLYQVLAPFREHGINLTRLESRPSLSSKWSYVFFIDFEGHYQDDKVAPVLKALEDKELDITFLGSYPMAVL